MYVFGKRAQAFFRKIEDEIWNATMHGSYMGVIMSELLHQTPKKDYFCEVEPSMNDNFACQCRQAIFRSLIKCQAHNKPPYKNLYFISGVIKRIVHKINIIF